MRAAGREPGRNGTNRNIKRSDGGGKMELAGKRALVPGAARGVGRAIARALAREGARLALPWFDWPESVAELEAEFAGGGHLLMRADLRREEEVAAVFARIGEAWGGLDILVNNIERGGMPVVHGDYSRPVNAGQWERELDTTLTAKRLLWRHALPLLRRAPEAAALNITSIAGLTGRSGPAGLLFSEGYAAANRAVSTLTTQWAREGAPTIRVNELMLGLIDTRHGPGTRGWQTLTETERQALLNHTLLQRTGRTEEVANAALFLLRDAEFCTGATLRLDGGYALGGEAAPEMPRGVLG